MTPTTKLAGGEERRCEVSIRTQRRANQMIEDLYDEDGIEGPFERRMERAMREDGSTADARRRSRHDESGLSCACSFYIGEDLLDKGAE